MEENSNHKIQISSSSSAKEVAVALLEMRPRLEIIPESLRSCLNSHVIQEIVILIPKPWKQQVDAKCFRDDIKFCFRIVGYIADEKERIASNAIILMTLFDWNWIRACRGERAAARRAWRLLIRVTLPREVFDSFPLLGVQFLLSQARLERLTNVEKAVVTYKETLDGLQKLTGTSGNNDMPRSELSLETHIRQELAESLYEASRYSETANHACAAAKGFENLRHDDGMYRALTFLGLSLREIGKNFEALAALKRVRDYALSTGDYAQAIGVAHKMWRLLAKLGYSRAAVRLLNRIVLLVRFSKDTKFEVVEKMADFFEEASEYTEALELLEVAFGRYQSSGDHRSALRCALAQTNLAIGKGDIRLASCSLRKARSVYVSDLGPAVRADLYSYVGHVSYATGRRFRQAARAYAKAGAFYSKHGSLEQLQSSYVDYGMACIEIGYAEESIRAIEAAIRLPLPRTSMERARIFAQGGSAYSRMTRYAEAANLLERAVSIYKAHAAWHEVALPLRQLGAVYYYTGDLVAAEECWVESLRLLLMQGNSKESAATANNLAILALRQGKPEKAAVWLVQALRALRSTSGDGRPFTILINLGQVLVDLGHLKSAFRIYKRALLAGRKEKVSPTRMAKVDIGIAKAYDLCGMKEKALLHSQKAIKRIESYRSHLELGRHRLGITELSLPLYAQTIRLCSDLKKHEEAFSMVQRANNRSFFEAVAHMRGLSLKHDSDISKNDPIAPKLAREAGVRIGDPQRLLRHAQREALGVSRTLELLGNHCLLQYFLFADKLFCCTLSRQTGIKVHSLPIASRREFRQEVQYLVRDLSWPEGTELLVKIQMALNQFYDILLRPIEHVFKESERIIIIPSAELFNIPFACLFDGTSYLVERHLVSYLPHAGMLKLPKISTPPTSWIGFGDPLDNLNYAKNEFAIVGALFDKLELYTGVDAKAENLFGKHADVIHIAARVSRSEISPFAASFEVWDGEGIVQLLSSDLVGADIKAKLAVLRCCFTGETREWFGGEVAAIWTCFLLGGCHAVLASPWQVYEDEDVSRLVVRFYELWKKDGKAPVEALALAQREAIARRVYPAMWGFPLLIGNV